MGRKSDSSCGGLVTPKLQAKAHRLLLEVAPDMPRAKLEKQVEEVEKVLESLELRCPVIPHRTKQRVATLVQDRKMTAECILERPGVLHHEDHSKYGAVVGTPLTQGSTTLKPAKHEFGKSSVKVYHLPEQVVQYFTKLRSQIDAKSQKTENDLADLEALGPCDGTKEGHLLIQAALIEWYSDRLMNALRALIKHKMRPSEAPLSHEILVTCTYDERAAVARDMCLHLPNMWNEALRRESSEWVDKQTLEPGRKEAVQTYMECREKNIAFDPDGSAESDIRRFVLPDHDNVKVVRMNGAEGPHRPQVTTMEVSCNNTAMVFRKLLEQHRQKATWSMSDWADVQSILVGPTHDGCDKICIDASLLEFYSKDFLLAVTGRMYNNCKATTRRAAIDFLIRELKLPVQRMSHRLPTSAQVHAYKRYLASPKCAHAHETRALALSSICAASSGADTLICNVTRDLIDEYPLDYLWLALRCNGSLATDCQGRRALFGQAAGTNVVDFEAGVAQDAYAGLETARCRKAILDAFRSNWEKCPLYSKEDCLEFPIRDHSDINLLADLKRTKIETLNIHDIDVLQFINQSKPRVVVRPAHINDLNDLLVHVLLHVLVDSSDEQEQGLCPIKYKKYVYPPAFRHGLVQNLATSQKRNKCATC